MYTRTGPALATLLLIFISYQSIGQSAPPDKILKWENDIARFDSLNLVELSDAGTLLVTGSSSVRMWDSIHTDMAPYQVMQRGYGGAKLTDFNYYADRIIKPQQIRKAGGHIASYCDRNDDLHFISTFDQYTTPEGLPDSNLFRGDMLHLNRDGYLQWAGIIKTSLEEAGITP